jgi:D-arabinose 1-dehydrogenase-like Zn-dependent alcohol dehydrogenase
VVRSQSILVYLNRQRLEDLNALKTISAGGIESAEWVEASRVQTILTDVPTGAIAGAIVIKTR